MLLGRDVRATGTWFNAANKTNADAFVKLQRFVNRGGTPAGDHAVAYAETRVVH